MAIFNCCKMYPRFLLK